MARYLVDTRGGRVILSIVNVGASKVVIPKGMELSRLEGIAMVGTTRGEDPNATPEPGGRLAEHLQPLIDGVDGELTEEQREEMAAVIQENTQLFAGPGNALWRTGLSRDRHTRSILQHEIDTQDHRPRKQPARRCPWGRQVALDQELDRMLTQGVVRPSTSAWASPVVLVAKKDGSVRFCVDYRKWKECLVYLDDVVVFGATFDHAFDNLRHVFKRLQEAGLKLKPSKCSLF
ncbi:PREDICTED: uncharacterized protein LOC106814064 [Priapulus caudatus]|uniref:Uncharacterized protein LOC106814064 n=1 Tax=Priapulus caudatus TaxID=37621 RepID=A0ABM1ENP9_PRICU|nr:PREDICTED: uncharacterized protein LOC106814064 [Priapulus caudatus]